MKALTLISLCAALLLAVPAGAEPLRLATVSLEPFGYREGEHIAGLAHDVAIAILEEAGFEPTEALVPLSSVERALEGGEADVVVATPTPALEAQAENLGSVFTMEMVVLGRHAQRLRTLRDVRGSILAAVEGTVTDERISRENGMEVYPTEDFEHSLKMLMARRVEFTVGPRVGLFHAARRLRLPRKALGRPLVISSVHYCLFVSRTVPPDEIERLKAARLRLANEGVLGKIVENYYL